MDNDDGSGILYAGVLTIGTILMIGVMQIPAVKRYIKRKDEEKKEQEEKERKELEEALKAYELAEEEKKMKRIDRILSKYGTKDNATLQKQVVALAEECIYLKDEISKLHDIRRDQNDQIIQIADKLNLKIF